jgi:hypothetical protein
MRKERAKNTMPKASKMENVENKVRENAKILFSVVQVLNKHKDYVFVGSFANIAHKHFRGCPLLQVLVYEAVSSDVREELEGLGLSRIDWENDTEIFSMDLLMRLQTTNEKAYFADAVKLSIPAFGMEFEIQFPSLEKHKKYLKAQGDFFSLEDIRMLENGDDFNKTNFHLPSKFEMYLCLMVLGKKHDHSKGSESCFMCKQIESAVDI